MTNIQHTNATQEFAREKQTRFKPSRRQDVLIKKKIKAEVNETEPKETIQKSMNQSAGSLRR